MKTKREIDTKTKAAYAQESTWTVYQVYLSEMSKKQTSIPESALRFFPFVAAKSWYIIGKYEQKHVQSIHFDSRLTTSYTSRSRIQFAM